MTNVGDCTDAHGASQGHIRVGESWVIPQWEERNEPTLSGDEFLPLQRLVTRRWEGRRTCYGSAEEERRYFKR